MKLTFNTKDDAIDFKLHVMLDRITIEPRPIVIHNYWHHPRPTVVIEHIPAPPEAPAPRP